MVVVVIAVAAWGSLNFATEFVNGHGARRVSKWGAGHKIQLGFQIEAQPLALNNKTGSECTQWN
eukprot:scaffold27380_cov52-Cyclotella_meneghiniana.AAC.5